MDDVIEQMVVSVRADTRGFAQDVAAMRDGLEGGLGAGADRAGRSIEAGLLRAVRTGKFGFEDLRRLALGVLDSIAASALKTGLGALGGLLGGGGGGLLSVIGGLVGGAPGRATGGPVSPGRASRVGEQGPELFVPTSAGSVVAAGAAGGGRDVRVSISVNAPDRSAPEALARSARQIARSVRGALEQ